MKLIVALALLPCAAAFAPVRSPAPARFATKVMSSAEAMEEPLKVTENFEMEAKAEAPVNERFKAITLANLDANGPVRALALSALPSLVGTIDGDLNEA